MALSAGSRLGPYEILGAIGAGGMGEVYRAKDTRLDRIVAIKVLPTHLSGNPQLKQRFEREARAISSLTHPNICALYDIGQQNGTEYLVMEYLEGESLAKRLDKGALPTEQVLKYGVQIAEALDRAHRKGIVHRDLKPGNVMITKSGAKLLDFGLAKYEVKTERAESTLETRDEPLTEEGMVLGTVQYMAPEQIEGKDSDARTDIFALGEVLYEMATGQRTFNGNSKAQLMASIMTADPQPISAVQPLAPPALDHVIKKCLAKDPEDRWQNARDLASELRWISEAGSQPHAVAAVATSRHKIALLIGWIVAAMFAGLAAVVFFHPLRQTHHPLKLSLLPQEGTRPSGQIAVSPDGKRLAFVASTKEGQGYLWVRAFDTLDSLRLPGTEDAIYPFWSPDGKSLGFFAQGKLKKIEVAGGPPQTLCDASAGRGGTWNQNGVVVFASSWQGGLDRISASGGSVEHVTSLDASRQETTHLYPHFLPDGYHFLYSIRSADPQNSGVYVGSLDSHDKRRLVPDIGRAEFSPSGYLLYIHETSLMAQPFDPKKLEFEGEAFPITDKVTFDGTYYSFSVSKSNDVLSYSDINYWQTQLVWFDRQGRQIQPVGDLSGWGEPFLSPDEKKLSVFRLNPGTNPDIWIADFARSSFSRFTFSQGSHYNGIWSPDGSRVVFSARMKSVYDLYERLSNGTGAEQLLFGSDHSKFADDWSQDGRYILYEDTDPKTKSDLCVLSMPEKKPQPFLQTEFNEAHAKFSPDGRWIAYASDEIGRPEIYVRSFPTAEGGKWQISTAGGDQPYWRKDGKELFYLSPDGKIMAVEIKTDKSFEAGVPNALFRANVTYNGLVGYDRNQYAVSGDGQRFLINSIPTEVSTGITLLFDWVFGVKK